MTYSPIAFAASYLERGFSPIPLTQGVNSKPGYAGVPMQKWSLFCAKAATALEVERWAVMDPTAGLALACGFNGLVAIDVDHLDGYPAAREVFGGIRPPTKIGSKGATAFFRADGLIQSRSFRAKKNPDGTPGEVLIEILAGGRCTTIPPTKHRKTGVPYRYHYASLEDLRVNELPLFTASMGEQLEQALSPLMEPKRIFEPAKVSVNPVSLDDRTRRRYAGYANSVLSAEMNKNLSAKKGARGRQLFNSICTLGRYVHRGILDAGAVTSALAAAAARNGLARENGPRDVMRTIESGLAFSMNDPLPILQERPR